MNYGESQLIITMAAIMKVGQTHYINPHPEAMQNLLKVYHNRDRSLQTYWRNMKKLEDENYITRRERWDTRDRSNPRRKPSILALTIKGAKYLYRMGNAWAAQIYGAMLKWAKKHDQRVPKYNEETLKIMDDYNQQLKEIVDRAIKLGYV